MLLLRKISLSLLLLLSWLIVPVGLLAALGWLVQQFPAVEVASARGVSDHSWDDLGYAYAQGTWVMENERIGSPQNVVAISCYRDIGQCFESVAEIFRGGSEVGVLTNRLEAFSIDSWNAETIAYSNANGCIRYTVVIDRRTESVTARREPDPAGSDTSCIGSSLVRDADLRMSLQDGWRVQQQLQRDAFNRVATWLWLAFGLWLLALAVGLMRVWRRTPPKAALNANRAEA